MKIKEQGHDYKINCTYKESMSLIINFQGKEISLDDVFDEYIDEIKKDRPIEILPGIYIEVNCDLNKMVMPQYNPYDTLWGITKSLLLAIKTKILQKSSIKISISIHNIKDYIKVYERTYKINNKKEHYEYDLKNYNERISPKLLPYPNTLGGGARGCIIWDIFQSIGLLECGWESAYEFYSLSEILDMTSKNEKLLAKCKKSKNCGYIIDKMINNNYKGKWEGGEGWDDISVELNRGKYRLYEGKHRVCMAKRFNIDVIPVEVTELIHKEIKYYSSSSMDLCIAHRKYTCREIMNDFYETLKKIGIHKEDSHELLKNSNNDIIEFIERKSGMSIIEIRDKCNDENYKKFTKDICKDV